MLGLVTIAVATWYMSYFAGNLVKSYLPVAALIPFVMWVGINVGLIHFAPRYALSRIELLTIFSMMWIVGSLPCGGVGVLCGESDSVARVFRLAGKSLARYSHSLFAQVVLFRCQYTRCTGGVHRASSRRSRAVATVGAAFFLVVCRLY